MDWGWELGEKCFFIKTLRILWVFFIHSRKKWPYIDSVGPLFINMHEMRWCCIVYRRSGSNSHNLEFFSFYKVVIRSGFYGNEYKPRSCHHVTLYCLWFEGQGSSIYMEDSCHSEILKMCSMSFKILFEGDKIPSELNF